MKHRHFLHLCTNFVAVIKSFSFAFLVGFGFMLLFGCASQVSPGGGPKDAEPPVVVRSEPLNFSTSFNQSTIQLTFNEFVKLKQANEQILISPPMKVRPEYRLRGKTVIIDLKEELLPNTTYSIFFGSAIVDITEENPLTDFLYVFSTGEYLDSLSVAGEVANAFTGLPEENIFVMLYSIGNDTVPVDSLPMSVRPLYVTKTDKNGIYRLQFLRNEPMKLFALNDMNSNYLFDIPDEEVAFADTLVIPEKPLTIEPEPVSDGNDSLMVRDSIIVRDLYKNYYPLRLFQHVDSTQRLLSGDGLLPPKFRLVFRHPAQNLSIELSEPQVEGDWKIEELNSRKDSLMVWLTRSEFDTLQVKISLADTVFDTIQIVIPEKKETKTTQRRRDADEPVKPQRLTVAGNVKSRTLDLTDSLILTFENPLVSFDFSDILMIAGNDTIIGAPFAPLDSIRRKFILEKRLNEETLYDFTFPDSILTDIYGLTNDSVRIVFKTKGLNEYGNLFIDLQIKDENHPYILQLLDIKDKIIREHYVHRSGEVKFELLNPAIYRLKAIRDAWPNRRWDTGDYIEKRQPEEVFFYPAELQVRPNWDIEEQWVIE
ncbi:MAG: Ig-like domain-containing protein [Bacteroidales bacterium]|nr:Ig-like domain-containing protein [Bacteroidales bacterium]